MQVLQTNSKQNHDFCFLAATVSDKKIGNKHSNWKKIGKSYKTELKGVLSWAWWLRRVSTSRGQDANQVVRKKGTTGQKAWEWPGWLGLEAPTRPSASQRMAGMPKSMSISSESTSKSLFLLPSWRLLVQEQRQRSWNLGLEESFSF